MCGYKLKNINKKGVHLLLKWIRIPLGQKFVIKRILCKCLHERTITVQQKEWKARLKIGFGFIFASYGLEWMGLLCSGHSPSLLSTLSLVEDLQVMCPRKSVPEYSWEEKSKGNLQPPSLSIKWGEAMSRDWKTYIVGTILSRIGHISADARNCISKRQFVQPLRGTWKEMWKNIRPASAIPIPSIFDLTKLRRNPKGDPFTCIH